MAHLETFSENSVRLKPEMRSMRLHVLRCVREYIGKWGESPSQSEIQAGLGISRRMTKDAIKSLVADGMLLRTPGSRGLRLPDERDAAVRVLQGLGYTVFPLGPNSSLPPPIRLDYLPETGSGD